VWRVEGGGVEGGGWGAVGGGRSMYGEVVRVLYIQYCAYPLHARAGAQHICPRPPRRGPRRRWIGGRPPVRAATLARQRLVECLQTGAVWSTCTCARHSCRGKYPVHGRARRASIVCIGGSASVDRSLLGAQEKRLLGSQSCTTTHTYVVHPPAYPPPACSATCRCQRSAREHRHMYVTPSANP
jgi:hypothetical protein